MKLIFGRDSLDGCHWLMLLREGVFFFTFLFAYSIFSILNTYVLYNTEVFFKFFS